MGTTVTAILRAGNKLAMAHLGDSRGYLLRDGELTQVTVDHTFVQHLVDTGRIKPEEAEHHPQRSVVMRVLGDFDVDVTPDLSVREARPGDRWLLCSDGLSGFVSHDTLAETLRDVTDVDACAERLVQLALRGGGGDNVTVIVADVVDLDDLPDGRAPSTAVSVVGAAAISRHKPSSAADGPAARAANLLRSSGTEGDPASDDEPEAVTGARPRTLLVVWGAALAVVLLLLGGGYAWSQGQYFVGASDGRVAVFRGLPTAVGPLDLSHVVETSDVSLDSLPSYLRERVAGSIHADSLSAARSQVQQLAGETVGPTPLPTFSAGPLPTFTLGPAPTVSVVPSPASSG